jgi:hypothetical protein
VAESIAGPYRRHRPQPRTPQEHEIELRQRAALLDEAWHIDLEQRRLAERMGAVRSMLAYSRVVMWPRVEARDIVYGFRRTRVKGPPPIPPPAKDAYWVRGRALRFAALAILARNHERALSLPEIHRELHLAGYGISSRTPVKRLADALGYEDRQGRVVRVERGWYRIGILSPAERRRALQHGDERQADPRWTRRATRSR